MELVVVWFLLPVEEPVTEFKLSFAASLLTGCWGLFIGLSVEYIIV